MLKFVVIEESISRSILEGKTLGSGKSELVEVNKRFHTEVQFINGVKLTINVHPSQLEKTLKELINENTN